MDAAAEPCVPLLSAEFSSLALSPALLAVVKELGYEGPTPIQLSSIPILLAGRDLIGQSRTGSGKTLAFGLPILQTLRLEPRALQALVICPTRELCAQVARELRKLGRKHEGLQVLTLAGGEPLRPQVAALRLGIHIAVGTPGRLVDHLHRRTLEAPALRTVVLDEADRMLEMGFEEEMEQILRALPKTRQTALFSATFPPTIETVSRAHQHDAVRVSVDDPTDGLAELRELKVCAEPADKLHALYWVLGQQPHESALIFCNFKATVATLTEALRRSGAAAEGLHGDLDQFHRDQVLARFRNQSLRLLVATDVAGRGLDVEGLDLVINFELPMQAVTYVHRVGRTGRAGRPGLAISLSTRSDGERLRAIEALRGRRLEALPAPPSGAGALSVLAEAFAGPARMQTILLAGGRKDKLRPGDILGALTGAAGGLSAAEVGRIELHDRLTFVAVAREVGRAATKALNAGRIKKKRFRATLV
ncbi:MAG: ATP-dependent RNA helicase DbpA [Proteobacteria bacterium]|nr:ATP-dependent RNA helicase DbpA [Pseudomonadota bacterium]